MMAKSDEDSEKRERSAEMADDFMADIERFRGQARAASDFLKALAHESRLLILCLVAERERSVTELETILALRQPAVSQQLARLRMDGLVTTRREGKAIYYSLADDEVRRIMGLLYDIFCREAAGENAGALSRRFEVAPKQ